MRGIREEVSAFKRKSEARIRLIKLNQQIQQDMVEKYTASIMNKLNIFTQSKDKINDEFLGEEEYMVMKS